MFFELIPFAMQKSIRSGIFLGPDGQYVGCLVVMHIKLLFLIDFCSSLPLVVVILEPQIVFLALKSPPTRNLLPNVFKKLV